MLFRLEDLQAAEVQLDALEHARALVQAQQGATQVARQLDQQQWLQLLQAQQTAAEREQVRGRQCRTDRHDDYHAQDCITVRPCNLLCCDL